MNARVIKIELTPGARLVLARFIARSRRLSPAQQRLSAAFAVKRVAHQINRNIVALGEDPSIPALARIERTQQVYPAPQPTEPLTVRFRSPGVERWMRLLIIPEDSVLCN
jgi:hypothetical protein